MPDWKIEQDYAFTDALDETGWAWEFLRRNPEYQKDYELFQAQESQSTGSKWMHGAASGDEPPSWKIGKKWQITGPIRDPKEKKPPPFMSAYPREPQFEDLGEFFDATPDDGGPTPQLPEFTTLVFDLRRPVAPQIEKATERLKQRQSQITVQKPPHKGSEKWPLYLRLLDAKRAGATTAEIIEVIEVYGHLGNEAADGYAADKAVATNLQAATSLTSRALTILK